MLYSNVTLASLDLQYVGGAKDVFFSNLRHICGANRLVQNLYADNTFSPRAAPCDPRWPAGSTKPARTAAGRVAWLGSPRECTGARAVSGQYKAGVL